MGLGGEVEGSNELLPQKIIINEQVVVGLTRCQNRSRGAGSIKREECAGGGKNRRTIRGDVLG